MPYDSTKLPRMNQYALPSWELTYPTWGKGKSSSKGLFKKGFPSGYPLLMCFRNRSQPRLIAYSSKRKASHFACSIGVFLLTKFPINSPKHWSIMAVPRVMLPGLRGIRRVEQRAANARRTSLRPGRDLRRHRSKRWPLQGFATGCHHQRATSTRKYWLWNIDVRIGDYFQNCFDVFISIYFLFLVWNLKCEN